MPAATSRASSETERTTATNLARAGGDRDDLPPVDDGGTSGLTGPGTRRRTALLAGGFLLGTLGLVLTYHLAKDSNGKGHFALFWASYGLVLVTALVLGLRARTDRARLGTLLALGAVTFLPKLLMTFDGPRYYDEYGHWRHANDIAGTHHLFVPTPYLPIQRRYFGLELLTAIVHWVTRLGTWHAGQLIVVVAHCAVLVVVWRMAKLLDLSNRAAVVASLLYALNSSYLFFDTQFSYESLALPLCFLAVALAMGARRADTDRGAWGLGGLSLLAGGACVVTHHVSTVVLVALLVVVAACTPVRRSSRAGRATRLAPWIVAGVIGAFAAVWLLVVAKSTYDYVGPHIREGAVDAGNWLRGRSTRTFDNGGVIETRRTLFSGTLLPIYEVVCGFLAPVLAVGAVIAAVIDHRLDRARSRERLRLLAPFYVLVAVYLVSLPLTLTLTGSETAHRAWAFGFVGVAVVVASAEHLWDDLISRFSVRRVATAGMAAFLVLAVGNIAIGENAYYRFPGPLQFATDTRSRGAELDDLAQWLDRSVPAGTKVVTDRFTGEAVIGYTHLQVPEPDDYLVYRLYREGGNLDPRLRTYLRDNHFEYFVLDRRIGHAEPVQKLFPGYTGPASVSADALATVGTTPQLQVVHQTPTYLVLRIAP